MAESIALVLGLDPSAHNGSKLNSEVRRGNWVQLAVEQVQDRLVEGADLVGR